MLVKATYASVNYNKALKEFHRVVQEGEIFEVSEDRFRFLHGGNQWGINFVEPYSQTTTTETLPSDDIPNAELTKITLEEKPEITLIEPGKSPVKVDENLQPIKKKTTKKKKVQTSEEIISK